MVNFTIHPFLLSHEEHYQHVSFSLSCAVAKKAKANNSRAWCLLLVPTQVVDLTTRIGRSFISPSGYVVGKMIGVSKNQESKAVKGLKITLLILVGIPTALLLTPLNIALQTIIELGHLLRSILATGAGLCNPQKEPFFLLTMQSSTKPTPPANGDDQKQSEAEDGSSSLKVTHVLEEGGLVEPADLNHQPEIFEDTADITLEAQEGHEDPIVFANLQTIIDNRMSKSITITAKTSIYKLRPKAWNLFIDEKGSIGTKNSKGSLALIITAKDHKKAETFINSFQIINKSRLKSIPFEAQEKLEATETALKAWLMAESGNNGSSIWDDRARSVLQKPRSKTQ